MKFSKEQLSILSNSHFLLTKHKLLEKIIYQFEEIKLWHLSQSAFYSAYTKDIFPNAISGKVSKGENYRGLPYLVLDIPRFFTQENTFALRTMFWWGNEFSYTLHLAGKPLDLYRKVHQQKLEKWAENNIHLCVNDSPWEYHFEKNNYVNLQDATSEIIEEHLHQKDFLKISRKLPLVKHESFNEFIQSSFFLFFK